MCQGQGRLCLPFYSRFLPLSGRRSSSLGLEESSCLRRAQCVRTGAWHVFTVCAHLSRGLRVLLASVEAAHVGTDGHLGFLRKRQGVGHAWVVGVLAGVVQHVHAHGSLCGQDLAGQPVDLRGRGLVFERRGQMCFGGACELWCILLQPSQASVRPLLWRGNPARASCCVL